MLPSRHAIVTGVCQSIPRRKFNMHALPHLLIAQINLNPDQEWSDSSAAWRFLRVRNGSAYWMGACRFRSLAEGDLVLLAPRVRGIIRASKLNDVLLQGFSFVPELLGGLFTLRERHFFDCCAPEALGNVRFFPAANPLSRRLGAVASREDAQAFVQRAELLALTATVFEAPLARRNPAAEFRSSAQRRCWEIINGMPDTEFIKYSLEELARDCRCSPRQFSRLLRKHFRTSGRNWQTRLRLIKAGQLLCETTQPVGQIALGTGFRDMRRFSSQFKESFGMTPSRWRRTWKRQATAYSQPPVKPADAGAPVTAEQGNPDTQAATVTES